MPDWSIVLLYYVSVTVVVIVFGVPVLFVLSMAWVTRPPVCPDCRRRRLRYEGPPLSRSGYYGRGRMAARPMYYQCSACGKKWLKLREEWSSVEDAEWERLKTEWINAGPDVHPSLWNGLQH